VGLETILIRALGHCGRRQLWGELTGSGLWSKGEGRADERYKTMGRMEFVSGMERGIVHNGATRSLGGGRVPVGACSVQGFNGQRNVI
jgi:hypothetical protein